MVAFQDLLPPDGVTFESKYLTLPVSHPTVAAVTHSALLMANPAYILQDPHEHRCALLGKVITSAPIHTMCYKWMPNFLLESSILRSQEIALSIGQIISLCLESYLDI